MKITTTGPSSRIEVSFGSSGEVAEGSPATQMDNESGQMADSGGQHPQSMKCVDATVRGNVTQRHGWRR